MRITGKGQVTIPQHIRNSLGLLPNTEVEFVEQGRKVFIKKVDSLNPRGDALIQRMAGKVQFERSTDEMMKLLRG